MAAAASQQRGHDHGRDGASARVFRQGSMQAAFSWTYYVLQTFKERRDHGAQMWAPDDCFVGRARTGAQVPPIRREGRMSTKGKSAVPTRKEKKARASLSDNRMVSGLTSTRASRRRTGTVQRERIVSKKSKSRTGGKGKLAGEAKHGLLTCDRIVENPERKWRLALAPNETVMVAEDAPPVQQTRSR
jgi:hypothetical protein